MVFSSVLAKRNPVGSHGKSLLTLIQTSNLIH